MLDDPVIRAKEAAPYVCGTGLHRFCDATGLDYMTLVREGYPVSRLLETGDTMCADVVAKVLAARQAVTDGR
ncbi:hypothetical protein GOD54_23640 [Sinorhizobium medicae]|nr:hypothetical protein [Sinorhizobium medicae]